MPEENVECGECGKAFTSTEYLEKHSRAEHGGDPVEPPEPEYGLKPDIVDRDFFLGAAAGLVVALLIFGLYGLNDGTLHEEPVDITVVTCESCNYSDFREQTDRLFDASYREVNYRSREGEKLIEKYNLYYVPGFIFEKDVRKRENFTKIKSVLVEFEDAYVLPDRVNRAAQRVSQGISLR